MSTTQIDKILLRQESSCELLYCIGDVPANTSVVQAWFMVKADLSDPDDQALISKTIDLGVSADGQVTDSGGTSGVAQLTFILGDTDPDALTMGKLYMSAVKVLLDSGLAYQAPYTRRPVRLLSPGIQRTS